MKNPLATLAFSISRGCRDVVTSLQRGWQQAWARGEDVHPGAAVQLHEAGRQSAWVFRCLQLIAGPLRSVPLEWYAPGAQEELDDADLLSFWRRPAITSGGVRLSFGDFVELSAHNIGLHGQAFWILDDTWLARGGQKSPLILARADRMSPIQAADTLLGWRFIDGAGKSFSLLPQQVIRPRFLSPYDDAAGLAPLQAAWIAASADHAAGLFARNVAESNGDQGVYVVSKSGTLSEEQRSQIIAQLRQKAALAKRGDFRAAFLTADVAIEDPKIKSVDSAFLASRQFSREEIACAFGVPASMLQKMDSYSIGAASDRYRLIDETCVPMGERLASAMEEVERLRSGLDVDAEFDWSAHSVMSQVRNEKLKSAAEVWRCGVPWQVLNDTMDLGLDAFAGSDRAWLPMGLEPVEGGPVKTDKPALPPAEEGKALLLRNTAALDTVLAHVTHHASRITPPVTKSTKRETLWQKHQRLRAPSEKLFKSKFTKVLMAARKETLAKLEASERSLAGVRQRGILDLIFDLADFTISLVNNLRGAHESTMTEATAQLMLELGMQDDPWQMESSAVLQHLSQRDNLIKDAAREVHEQILATLQEGLQNGETTAELAGRVRSAFNGIADERAVMIAATETAASYGAVRHAAVEDLEIPFKQWLSAQDDRVRDTHRRIDGTIVPSNDPFRVPRKDGGEDLMQHPCDPAGSAENCIQCRCIEVPMMTEEGE
jgi:SPP1 gp7 family putative phage head morphogenesis protein